MRIYVTFDNNIAFSYRSFKLFCNGFVIHFGFYCGILPFYESTVRVLILAGFIF